ncbi:MAG: hypothetical protein HYY63_00875 [Elusimicrobia bacterium]|nr:hypothetical protein [Elusimicrobiota bacterium]
MNRLRRLLFLALLLWLVPFHFCRVAWSAYEERYWSARVASLGGAYEALSDDSVGIFYNTAGLIQARGKDASFSYARLFTNLSGVNLSLSQFGYLHPLGERRRVGIGWGSFGTSDLYREDTVVIGYCEDVASLVPDMKGIFSLGISARYLLRKFTLDDRASGDPLFKDGSSKGVPAFDIHLYTKPDFEILNGFSFGVSLKSLNQPEIGFKDKEKLPQELAAGTVYEWKNLKIPFDLTVRNSKMRPHAGTEIKFMQGEVAVRAGSDLDQLGGGLGYGKNLGSNYSLTVDYGFLWPLTVESTAGSHRVTLGIKF